MKVYLLTFNEVEQPRGMVASSYVSTRRERRIEYFASREGAEARQREVYEGMKKLIGFIDGFEAVISERELLP